MYITFSMVFVSQIVRLEDDDDVEHELDLTTCIDFYSDDGNDEFDI